MANNQSDIAQTIVQAAVKAVKARVQAIYKNNIVKSSE